MVQPDPRRSRRCGPGFITEDLDQVRVPAGRVDEQIQRADVECDGSVSSRLDQGIAGGVGCEVPDIEGFDPL
jgi:hypothetical protein